MELTRAPNPPFVTDAEAATLLAACRVLMAITARSATGLAATVDPAMLRTLLVVADLGHASPDEVARAAGLTPTAVRRHCERLVQAGLLQQTDQPNPPLTLDPSARGVIDALVRCRRDALRLAMSRLPVARRLELAAVLAELGHAASPTEI